LATSTDTAANNPTRELAAIMFSDVVGYTAIMGRDEQKGVQAIADHRAELLSLLPRFNGRLIGEIGDGTLTSFHSVLDAIGCARELQANLKDDAELRLRIGIHLGDVLLTNNTVLGDGVNVASRLHALAPPGGICVSEHVYDEIRNKPGMVARNLGKKNLKNVSRPIRVYALSATSDDGGAFAALSSQTHRRWIRNSVAGAVVAILVSSIAYEVTMRKLHRAPATQQPSIAKPIRSLAVLPLENLSGDPKEEYFADGMTEELITDLAKIGALRVISRTSVMKFKGEHREQLPEIAKMLNVDAVVEGSVLRVGNRVRITAQLIDAPADKHLWAKSYERDARDVLAVQDEIASAIAREINLELTPDERARLAQARSVNPEAHEAYLKGRYYLNELSEERINKAIEQFERAIKLDPNFAPAHTGLADAYSLGEGFFFAPSVIPKAKDAVERALQLDDTSAEAHTSLGLFKYSFDYDWAGAETELRRAIALNPSYAEAHHQYGWVLALQGREDEALVEFKRASELDPLSPWIASDVTFPLAIQGRYADAVQQCREARDLDPNASIQCIGWPDLEAGKFREFIVEIEKAKAQESAPFNVAFLGYCYAATGDRTRAKAMLKELNQMASQRYVSPVAEAYIYIGLGDRERALERLEQAYQTGSSMLFFLKVDHIYDPLRSDPRFIELLKKVRLDK
jgi:adenylate cyclase